MQFRLGTMDRKSFIGSFLLALPMALLFTVIIFKIQWVETLMKSVLTTNGETPNTFGFVYMGLGLLALPVALLWALLPMLRKDMKGNRHLFWVNAILAALIITIMVPTWGGLLKDVYNCDILGIPNCD